MRKSVNDLSHLISSGRTKRGVPTSRSEVLAALLRKRAAAWRGGLSDLEARLRNQILWSLPVEAPEDRPPVHASLPEQEPDRTEVARSDVTAKS